MPRVASPSMPSQFESAKPASGSSIVDGGAQVPHPLEPAHVWVPAHTFHVVGMLHGCVAPGFVASQSHAALVAMHCL